MPLGCFQQWCSAIHTLASDILKNKMILSILAYRVKFDQISNVHVWRANLIEACQGFTSHNGFNRTLANVHRLVKKVRQLNFTSCPSVVLSHAWLIFDHSMEQINTISSWYESLILPISGTVNSVSSHLVSLLNSPNIQCDCYKTHILASFLPFAR